MWDGLMWGWIKRTAKRVWRGVRGTVRFSLIFFTTIFFLLIKATSTHPDGDAGRYKLGESIWR